MEAPPFTEEDLRRVLRDCFVPLQRRDVVTAGLVRSATVKPDLDAPGAGIAGVPPRFFARVVLGSPGGDEVLGTQLRALVENRLLGLQEISRAEVTMLPPLFQILSRTL